MPSLPEIGSSLPDVALRTAIVYLFLVVAMRISGKREVGQMSVLELVVILVISDAVQNSMVGENTSLWGGMIAVVTLLTLDFLLARLMVHSTRVRKVIEGEPRLIVRDGRLLEKAVDEEGLSTDEIEAAMRAHGLERIEDAALAVLETNGSISVIPRRDLETSPPPSVTSPGAGESAGS
jgi:uncharacterized membrane protein YcaP (DUF421 family)